MRRRLDHSVFVLWLVLASCSRTDPELDGAQRPRALAHWRVVWTEDPAHEALVAWSTTNPGTVHQVVIEPKTAARFPSSSARIVSASRSGPYARDDADQHTPRHWHHVELRALQPATHYRFRIESDGLKSPTFEFQTAPASDTEFALLVGGDSRSDRETRRSMNRRMRGLADADPQILALVHGGDYVYDGRRFDLFDDWMTDHELLADEQGRILPIVPTRGNHEATGELYDQVFGSPGGGLGKNWFRCGLGSEVGLVVLNTEVPTGGDQMKFLQDSLTAMQDRRWLLASYHQPAFPSVKLPSSALVNFVPLFDRYDLDLALESDGHTLKRTVPIRDGKPDPRGVVYIGEGGLGVRQRTPAGGRWYLRDGGFAQSAHHVWLLQFTSQRLTLSAILEDGEIADRKELLPKIR
ncbi:MAG: fibronectin type III domain-containing protein [Planctomycetota bacterium]